MLAILRSFTRFLAQGCDVINGDDIRSNREVD